MNRRLLMSIGLIALGLIVVLVLVISRQKKPSTTTTSLPTATTLPAAPGSGLSPDTKTLYQPSGNSIVVVDRLTGKAKTTLQPSIGSRPITGIAADPTGTQLLLSVGSAANSQLVIFNPTTNKTVELDRSAVNATFSPDGQRVAYHFQQDLGPSTLSIVPAAGGQFAQIVELPESFPYSLYWQTENELYAIAEPTDLGGSELLNIDLIKKTFSSVANFSGTSPWFNPDNTLIVYGHFVESTSNYELSLLTLGGERRGLGVTGIPTSVAFSANGQSAVAIIDGILYQLRLQSGQATALTVPNITNPISLAATRTGLLIETATGIHEVAFP